MGDENNNTDTFPAEYVAKLEVECDELKAKLDGAERELAAVEGKSALLDEMRQENYRLRRNLVGIQNGLPKELVGRLRGKTDVELHEDADRLARSIQPDDEALADALRRHRRAH